MHTGSIKAAMPPNTTEPVSAYITPKATPMWSSTWLVVFAAKTMVHSVARDYRNAQLDVPMLMIATPRASSAMPAASNADSRSRNRRRDTA